MHFQAIRISAISFVKKSEIPPETAARFKVVAGGEEVPIGNQEFQRNEGIATVLSGLGTGVRERLGLPPLRQTLLLGCRHPSPP